MRMSNSNDINLTQDKTPSESALIDESIVDEIEIYETQKL